MNAQTQGFTLTTYKTVRDIQNEHPEIKSLKALFTIPRGMEAGGIVMYLHRRNVQGHIFRVGNVIWKEAEALQKVTPCPAE
jgi:hypothetical protein